MVDLNSSVIIAGRYRLLDRLGQGGMGAVYLARDLRFQRRTVALKENLNPAPEARAQFRLEAELLATLRHPHLPNVTDHLITREGRQFLVMDYVEGQTLTERVQQTGPIPETQARAWGTQVLDALTYLHAQTPPIIHRDVKPDNVRLTPEGKAMLVDFGVAKYLIPGQHTATVARAGSPGYAPPEQYAGGTDARTDVYAVGGLLYFALTGQAPLEAPLRAAGQPMPPPRVLNRNISRRTERIILRAMAVDAAQRFQSAAAMRRALTGRAPTAERRQRWRQMGAGVALVLLLSSAGYAGWTMWHDGAAKAPTTPPTMSTPTVTPERATVESESPASSKRPRPQPSPMPSITSTPKNSPTSTATSTSTPGPTSRPQATATHTPAPAVAPELLAPSTSGEHPNPITFEWRGTLGAGQRYQVIATHKESGYTTRSDPLTTQQWTVELPPEAFGEWTWRVIVLSGNVEAATSEERVLWFNPMPGGGGGGNDDGGNGGNGGEEPTTEEPTEEPQPTNPPPTNNP